MLNDYYTTAEFRSTVADITVPHRYDDTDIARAQDEVIRRFEFWARTSWKQRTRAETHQSNVALVVLTRLPISSLTSVVLDGDTLTLADLQVDYAAGIIRWGDWSLSAPRLSPPGLVVVTYKFGYNEDSGIPEHVIEDWSIKRPCIDAAKTLLDGEEGRGKVPRNALRYSSERTDITLGRRGAGKPFPWDARASDDLRAYIEPRRAKGWVATTPSA